MSTDAKVWCENGIDEMSQLRAFTQNGGIYLSVDTISKAIDENIFYDSVATKVIVTTDTEVIKLKIDENKLSRNFEYEDIHTPAKPAPDPWKTPAG